MNRSPRWFLKLRSNWFTMAAGAMLMAILIVSALGPLVAPYDPTRGQLSNRFQPPSAEHWVGTDHLGRDVLSRIIAGGRTSVLVGLGAVVMGLMVGGTMGTVAAYAGGAIDNVLMRIVDVLMTFPYILLAILIVTILGFSVVNVVIAIGVSSVPGYARLARSLVISIMEQDYVRAAQGLGANNARIILRHLLPNFANPLIIYCSLTLGRAILSEAGLSFLGLGIQSPDMSWGILVAEGGAYLRAYPHLALVPGIAIMLTVFCLNMLGDALRDALDPTILR